MRCVAMLGLMGIALAINLCCGPHLFADPPDSLESLRRLKLAAAEKWHAELTAREMAAKDVDLSQAVSSAQALRDARLDAATDHAERVRALEAYRDQMQALYDKTSRLFQQGRKGGERHSEAQFHLANAKLALAIAAAKPATEGKAGKIEGRVIVNGAPLAQGKITFSSGDGQFFGGAVLEGSFAIKLVPTGKRKVAIEGKGVAAKYTSAPSSALSVSVQPGENVIDFSLSD